MKILTVIGARPQFIKAGIVSNTISNESGLSEIVVHTGQHFDENMSGLFFSQLKLASPQYNLNINGGSHGEMTGKMLLELEKVLIKEKPDRVLVYGDTNSTLAGALAAVKLHIPVAHVEAGLRSFNMKMPEEVNRILTDQLSNQLFCPTSVAVENLHKEGFNNKKVDILNVGDVMQDSALYFAGQAIAPKGLSGVKDFILATIHRAENTDCQTRLVGIVEALNELHNDKHVVLPLHPRTRAAISTFGLKLNVNVIDPVGYLEMLWLLKHSALVITDSGGLQKEAYFFGKPCITARDQTEWVELVKVDANILAGADRVSIIDYANKRFGTTLKDDKQLYGGGKAAGRIVSALLE